MEKFLEKLLSLVTIYFTKRQTYDYRFYSFDGKEENKQLKIANSIEYEFINSGSTYCILNDTLILYPKFMGIEPTRVKFTMNKNEVDVNVYEYRFKEIAAGDPVMGIVTPASQQTVAAYSEVVNAHVETIPAHTETAGAHTETIDPYAGTSTQNLITGAGTFNVPQQTINIPDVTTLIPDQNIVVPSYNIDIPAHVIDSTAFTQNNQLVPYNATGAVAHFNKLQVIVKQVSRQ